MLFNLKTADWDDELLQLLNVPRSVLPQIRASSEVYGTTQPALFVSEIKIAGIAGDQQRRCLDRTVFRTVWSRTRTVQAASC